MTWCRLYRSLPSLLLLASLSPATRALGADDPVYTVTDLGDFGYAGAWTIPEGINAAGDVVGYSCQPDVSGCHSEAFVRRGGALSSLGTLGGHFSWAYDINASGVVVGTASKPGVTMRAFRHEGGEMIDLDPLGGSQATANATNDDGTIVGWANTPQSGSNHAFVCEGSSCTDLHGTMPLGAMQSVATDVGATGDVVGFYITSGAHRAFLYRGGTRIDLPAPGSFSEAVAVNAAGMVAGNADGRAVLWDASDPDNLTMQDRGALGGYYSWTFDLNEAGHVVGASYASGGERAFLHREGRMVDLNTLIPADSGWRLSRATAINDAGQIVGYGSRANPSGTRGFLLSPLTPAERIANLIAAVQAFGLSGGMETSFVKKLENALAFLEAGDTAAACDLMLAVIQHAEAQAGKALTGAQAAKLVADATAVRTAIGCP